MRLLFVVIGCCLFSGELFGQQEICAAVVSPGYELDTAVTVLPGESGTLLLKGSLTLWESGVSPFGVGMPSQLWPDDLLLGFGGGMVPLLIPVVWVIEPVMVLPWGER